MLYFFSLPIDPDPLVRDHVVRVFAHLEDLHFPGGPLLVSHLAGTLVEEGVLLLLGQGGASPVAEALLSHGLAHCAVHCVVHCVFHFVRCAVCGVVIYFLF
jgi:hypothetical protein